jgi:hypothetical protein
VLDVLRVMVKATTPGGSRGDAMVGNSHSTQVPISSVARMRARARVCACVCA